LEIVGSIKHVRICQIGIGEGRNSEVFRALDPQLGSEFAIKVVEKVRFGGDVAKYFEEAKAMFANTHRNVVPIQYACEDTTHVMLAMPYYANGSLAARIASSPLRPTDFIRIAIGILHGVLQIHSKGYIHFDLKPSNVLFNDLDEPMVSDFGQTKRLIAGGIVSVPRMYWRAMPPEALNSGLGSALGDIYQIGLLLYRAVNGDAFFDSQFCGIDGDAVRRFVAAGKLPDRKRFLPHVPKRIRTVIRRALSVDPSNRFQSAEEFATTIARIRVGLNWTTNVDGSGQIAWYASRPGKADLEVQLFNRAGNWGIGAWTANGSSRRMTGGATMNRSGLERNAALACLNGVFAQLA
jgi:serine/threonine protein kinase